MLAEGYENQSQPICKPRTLTSFNGAPEPLLCTIQIWMERDMTSGAHQMFFMILGRLLLLRSPQRLVSSIS